MPVSRTMPRSGLFLFFAGLCCLVARPGWGEKQIATSRGDILARSYQLSTARSIISHSARSTGPKKQRLKPDAEALFNPDKLDRVGHFQTLIEEHSKANGLDSELVKAVIYTESGGNPRALSSKGAAGLMQLMPDTAAELGVEDRFDPEQNIASGTRYLGSLLERFRSVELALWAYNAGPEAVRQDRMPRETQNYVPQVLKLRRYLKAHTGN